MKLAKKADFILLVILLLAVGLCFLPKFLPSTATDITAVVSVNGKEVERIPLGTVTEAYTLSLDCNPKVTLTVEPGCIYYSSADCKDKICVHTGRLTRAGDSAACLPSKTSIVLVGTDKDAPDALTY